MILMKDGATPVGWDRRLHRENKKEMRKKFQGLNTISGSIDFSAGKYDEETERGENMCVYVCLYRVSWCSGQIIVVIFVVHGA